MLFEYELLVAYFSFEATFELFRRLISRDVPVLYRHNRQAKEPVLNWIFNHFANSSMSERHNLLHNLFICCSLELDLLKNT